MPVVFIEVVSIFHQLNKTTAAVGLKKMRAREFEGSLPAAAALCGIQGLFNRAKESFYVIFIHGPTAAGLPNPKGRFTIKSADV